MIKVMSGSFLHKLLLVLFVWSALLASGQAVAAWAKLSTHLPVYTSSEWYDLSEAPFPLTSATLEVCSKLNDLPNCSFRWGGSRRCRGSCNNGNHGYDLGLRYEFAYEDPNQPPPPEKKYTIELTPVTALAYGNYLTAIEPDGITRSNVPENLINKVKLIAEVKDQDGNSVNADIKLKVTALEGSGGHAQDYHTERNPSQTGKLKVGTLNSDTINIPKSGMVGGIVEFEYAASAISGDHKIEATCTNIDCKQIGQDSVWVGIQNLYQLPALSDYEFVGQTKHHPYNHYATTRVIQKIQAIAREYREWFPTGNILHINDISLEQGGLFDAKSDKQPPVMASWITPHVLHRTGEDVDIRANQKTGSIPAENYDDFELSALDNGCVADIHLSGSTAQHYHLYCTQKQGK